MWSSYSNPPAPKHAAGRVDSATKPATAGLPPSPSVCVWCRSPGQCRRPSGCDNFGFVRAHDDASTAATATSAAAAALISQNIANCVPSATGEVLSRVPYTR